ncbi:MAG TPA: fructokinase [Marinilabiliales bacterium]|nr:fructokinase [Marinilabiliales bacterium]
MYRFILTNIKKKYKFIQFLIFYTYCVYLAVHFNVTIPMIYTLGETVLDIIIKSMDKVQMRPGGSMLNTAVSLGRLGLSVEHISVLSTDQAAALLIGFLKENGVGSQFMYQDASLKTNLALAFLDEKNHAHYSFYKNKSPKTPEIPLPDPIKNDFILFGSFFSLNAEIHPQVMNWLQQAKQNNALILYDPNFRKPHLPQLTSLMSLIEQNLEMADIIKASDEDLENILGVQGVDKAWEKMQAYHPKGLIYTMGKDGAWLVTPEHRVFVGAKNIKPVSTIGAGDTFSAGILFYMQLMLERQTKVEQFSDSHWKTCLQLANEFAAQTCQSYDNYLSVDYAKNISHVQ